MHSGLDDLGDASPELGLALGFARQGAAVAVLLLVIILGVILQKQRSDLN